MGTFALYEISCRKWLLFQVWFWKAWALAFVKNILDYTSVMI
jgi:hypothetical protein